MAEGQPDLATITGAGGTITIGGRLLTIRQLTAGDLGMLRAWVLERIPRPMSRYLEEMKEIQELREIDQEQYEKAAKELLLKAHAEKVGGPDPEAVSQVNNSQEGLAYMIWLSCRQMHPTETFESINAGITTENITDLQKKMDWVNKQWMPPDKEDEQSQRPTANPALMPG